MKILSKIYEILYEAEKQHSDHARFKAVQDVLWLISKYEENERLLFEHLDIDRKCRY
jgi:hypothetical protein